MRALWQGMPVTELRSPDGAFARIADHGAHVLSWIPAGGDDALYLSAASGYGQGVAVRGGVPIIFPQFGERGSGRRHGFARNSLWRLACAEIVQHEAVARYVLDRRDTAPEDWEHAFALAYEVRVAGGQLSLALTVSNPSPVAWACHAALHTYLQVGDLASVALQGLENLNYLDQTQDGRAFVQAPAPLRFTGEIDRIYADVSAPLLLTESGGNSEPAGTRAVRIAQEGFRDTVVWNPGAEKAAALRDLSPGGQTRFVCVEGAAVLQAIALAPGASWTGRQLLTLA